MSLHQIFKLQQVLKSGKTETFPNTAERLTAFEKKYGAYPPPPVPAQEQLPPPPPPVKNY